MLTSAQLQQSAPQAVLGLAEMPLCELTIHCAEQLARFRAGQPNDPRYSFELCHRAIDRHDPHAWHALIEIFQPMLLAPLRQQQVDPTLAEDVWQEALTTLWAKCRSGEFSTEGRSLAEVLTFMRGGVHFALCSYRRRQREFVLLGDHTQDGALAIPGVEGVVEQQIDMAVMLGQVQRYLSEQEWRLLWLRFGMGYPPRQIAAQLAMSVERVSAQLATILRRLRSNSRLQATAQIQGWL
ncbi:MAG: hypothetical protein Fur005_34090 [Roseiflexaceae bacterium]